MKPVATLGTSRAHEAASVSAPRAVLTLRIRIIRRLVMAFSGRALGGAGRQQTAMP
jgi:hypothetical protein